jgi:hypothetical protein
MRNAACLALLALLWGPTLAQVTGAQGHRFDIIFQVVSSPRCMNCHVGGDTPKQGNERRRHDFQVVRGADGHGAAAMRCSACHTDRNYQTFPGAPQWGLAPLSMAWEGLDAGALCRQLKDARRNGGRSVAQIVTHMSDDPLVAWGWEPGGTREPVPVPRAEFLRGLQAWAAAGAPCPSAGVR